MIFDGSLRRAAAASGIALDEASLTACAAHYRLLVPWNRTHNLTRIVGPEEAARLHYLDCLAPLVGGEVPPAFVDVGSGAGFPGLLAALVWSSSEAFLIEPSKKRASFLVLASAEMGLDPARVTVLDAGASVTAPRVLSRATFSAGSRQTLTRYAAPGGEVAVWGHPHDVSTWGNEVATWGWNALSARTYRIEGLEERCLLRASAAAPK